VPSGACVLRYEGARGVVWRIKYRDADGKQVMETLGPEREGWTHRKAEAELRERLVRVERKSYRRPAPLTFGEYADTWFAEGATRRRWKPSTVAQYRSLKRRLVEDFGPMPLAAIRPRHIAQYVAVKSGEFGASVVGRDVGLLHAIFKTAIKEELVDSNPAAGAERPKLPRRQWRILEPVEVARVSKAFTDEQAKTVFLTLVLTGIRRSELQALRWRDVDLVENVIKIRDSKSEDGADMKTTKTYMHMAGVVFHDEADRLEARLLGVESSTRMSESESIERDLNRVAVRSDDPTD
jgi:integrase